LAGSGEVARYIGRHGTKRVAKAVLIGTVPPLMLKIAANACGMPIEVFDQLSWQLSPGVLNFSAESINGMNPAAGILRLPGQSKLLFKTKFSFHRHLNETG
jgi:hypothetical protein